jgi:hypothetical protein
MTDHDESIVEKAKEAIGLDDEGDITGADERPGGWAGVDDALGGVGDRPAGTFYGPGDVEDDAEDGTRREHQP